MARTTLLNFAPGGDFRMKSFMDAFNAAGLIPVSLIEWEMTGQKSPELERMLK